MTPQEQLDKLATISMLTHQELVGWHRLVTGSAPFCRPAFPGEMAALQSRAQKLGVTLSTRAQSASATANPLQSRDTAASMKS